MKERKTTRVASWLMVFAILCSFTFLYSFAYAADNAINIDGKVFSFDEKSHYEFSSSETFEAAKPGTNTYGKFSVCGDLSMDGTKNDVPSFLVNGETAQLVYVHSIGILCRRTNRRTRIFNLLTHGKLTD